MSDIPDIIKPPGPEPKAPWEEMLQIFGERQDMINVALFESIKMIEKRIKILEKGQEK